VESYSGKIVLELNADKRRPVASLTKIATAMVVLDWAKLSGTSMAEIAIVPQGTSLIGGFNPMGLIPGDRISLREAMYSMLLGSDNVAAATFGGPCGTLDSEPFRGIVTRGGFCDRDEQPLPVDLGCSRLALLIHMGWMEIDHRAFRLLAIWHV
jgi:hypothetical protein